MIKRHEDQLWARLDGLFANGITTITWGELYHWYDAEKIRKAPWRDIKARWEQLLDEKSEKYVDPKVAETGGGISLFYAKKPGTLSELAS
jgi:hypothetical protein